MENRPTNRRAYKDRNVREHHRSAAPATAHRGREAQTRTGRPGNAVAILESIKYIAGLAFIAAGFLLTYGTVGSMELNRIDFTQALIQCAAGIALMGLGWLPFYKILKEIKNDEQHHH